MAIRTLIEAVKAGNALIIFPEGRITVTGSLMKVYDGAAMIADKSNAEVVPVRIEGLEQTPFSRLSKEQVRRKWFPKVKVTILEPVKLSVDPELKGRKRRLAAGAALYGIMSDLVFRTTSTDRTVFRAVIDAAHQHGSNRVAVEDPLTGEPHLQEAAGRRRDPRQQAHAAGAGRPRHRRHAAECQRRGRDDSRPDVGGPRARDDQFHRRRHQHPRRLQGGAARQDRHVALLRREGQAHQPGGDARTDRRHRLSGRRSRERHLRRQDPRPAATPKSRWWSAKPDDWAAILFTSGSEGVPKGVVLSHRNMLANAAQAAARIDFGRSDKVFNVLPVFHSFGLTVGLMLPLVSGVQIYLYPSPLHYRTVAELIYGVNATIMFGTDTFLAGYARVAHPYDFRSLRYILAGAEPVKESTRRTYMEKFGLRILEGYGVTETAPALALNTPMFNKFGTVGRILPGMEARLEKVEGVEEGGRLFVRGPNVMLGYLKVDNPGVLEPPEEGWHDTGDIVTIDEQGFVAIKGRAKRFAKVAGEMISLSAVEALASDLWPNAPSAVIAVPDARRGERLILVTQQKNASRAEIQAFAKAKHASDLMIPSDVWTVDKLPMLGSGKVDNISLAEIVRERLAAAPPKPAVLV